MTERSEMIEEMADAMCLEDGWMNQANAAADVLLARVVGIVEDVEARAFTEPEWHDLLKKGAVVCADNIATRIRALME